MTAQVVGGERKKATPGAHRCCRRVWLYAESSTALLLNLKPKNMVLLGDHMQLPPCSLVPPHA